ncbi:MAG: ABC transporter permease [Coprobacillus sp.]
MFNLLRMDIKRLKKSKSSYVILILSMLLCLLAFMALYIALNPDLQAWMREHGFIFQFNGTDSSQIQMTLIDTFQNTYIQSFFALFIGIMVVLFNCHENECGFSKNIFSIHVNRSHYLFSKIISLSLYFILVISICFIETIVLNLCLSSFFIVNPINEIILYLVMLWFLTIALVCLYSALSIWLKSKSGCIGTVIVYATGIWLSIIQPLLGIIGWQHILDYTLMNNINILAQNVKNIDMNSILVMIVNVGIYIVVFIVLSLLRLRKKDI